MLTKEKATTDAEAPLNLELDTTIFAGGIAEKGFMDGSPQAAITRWGCTGWVCRQFTIGCPSRSCY